MSTVKRTAASSAARKEPVRGKRGHTQFKAAASEAPGGRSGSTGKPRGPEKVARPADAETPSRSAPSPLPRSQKSSAPPSQPAHAMSAAVGLSSPVTSSPGLLHWGNEPVAASLQNAVDVGGDALSRLAGFFAGESSATHPLRAETTPPQTQDIGEDITSNAEEVQSFTQSFFDPETQSPIFWTRALDAKTLTALLANSLKHPLYKKRKRAIEVPHMKAVPLPSSAEDESQLVADSTNAVLQALGKFRPLVNVSSNLHKVEIPHLGKQVLLLTTLVSPKDKATGATPLHLRSVLSQKEVDSIMSFLKKQKEGDALELSINMEGSSHRLKAVEKERLRLLLLAAGVATSSKDITSRSLGGNELLVNITGTFVRAMLE